MRAIVVYLSIVRAIVVYLSTSIVVYLSIVRAIVVYTEPVTDTLMIPSTAGKAGPNQSNHSFVPGEMKMLQIYCVYSV